MHFGARAFVGFSALLAAAAGPVLPPSTFARLSAARAHAVDLARLWNASHANSPANAYDGPVITSGRIVASAVDVQQAPYSPSLTFSFKAGGSGISNAYFQFYNIDTQQTFTLTFNSSTALDRGTYTISDPGALSMYAAPGTYTLLYAGIGNNAGQFRFYDSTQINAVFSSTDVSVINSGTPDNTRPTLYSGRIKTPVVSLSSAKALFVADLLVSDTVSGVHGGFVELQDPNGNVYSAYNQTPSPFTTRGRLSVGFDFTTAGGASLPTGTWSIYEVFVMDEAGNSLEVGGAPTIGKLFGSTTFQVTP